MIPISPGAFNNGSGEWTCLHGIKVSISRWIDDHQPGWVECELSDATGVMHRFHEKAPVVTGAQLGPLSQFPQPGVIDCMIVGRRRAPDGREVVSVDTSLPWGIKSTGGQSLFDVHASGLVDLGTSEAEDGG